MMGHEGLPACYRGTPEEMIVSMAGPGFTVESAVEHIVKTLHLRRDLNVHLPSNAPPRVQAAFLVAILLITGCAKETPSA
jgi:hypothetical protein